MLARVEARGLVTAFDVVGADLAEVEQMMADLTSAATAAARVPEGSVRMRFWSYRQDEGEIALPDLLTELQERTQLTRRSIQRVLADSGRLDDFAQNPQQFIELAAEAINRCKRLVT